MSLYDNISVQLVGRMSRLLYLVAIASVANYGTLLMRVIFINKCKTVSIDEQRQHTISTK